ncbi:MAG TPA: hypothetical protein VIM98_01605 [Dyella sp.]
MGYFSSFSSSPLVQSQDADGTEAAQGTVLSVEEAAEIDTQD